jgi:hypothetical protein
MEFETPLCELAFKYGSDKCPQIKHSYTPFYFNFFRGIDVRKLFEIGIGDANEMAWTEVPGYITGASLRMWRDFFSNAQIYGMDIKESCLFEDERIKTFQGDQSNSSDLHRILKEIGNDLDVVIDDGSHNPEHQIFTCKFLMPYLPENIIYIIEDAGHPEIVEKLNKYDCTIPYFKRRVRRDDRIIVIRNRNV